MASLGEEALWVDFRGGRKIDTQLFLGLEALEDLRGRRERRSDGEGSWHNQASNGDKDWRRTLGSAGSETIEVEDITASSSKPRTSLDEGQHAGGSMAELIEQQREEAKKRRSRGNSEKQLIMRFFF
ncbi:unnamed protein product [Prunus armeniaca]|uniref:Uncharacterized protein n=1 Tax=Prunus armeniaca TaxID=36596 RepID=A0A6J5WE60_PRUAR|nr:unnamed protein product [Prunus armeniaca]